MFTSRKQVWLVLGSSIAFFLHLCQTSYRQVVQMTSGAAGVSSADFPASFRGGVEAHGHLNLKAS